MDGKKDEDESNSCLETMQSFRTTDLGGNTMIFNCRSIKELRLLVAESLETCTMCVRLQDHSGNEVTDDRFTDFTDLFVVKLVELEEEMKLWDASVWGEKIVDSIFLEDVRYLDALSLLATPETTGRVLDVIAEMEDLVDHHEADMSNADFIYICGALLEKMNGWTPYNSCWILESLVKRNGLYLVQVLFAKVNGWTADDLQGALERAAYSGNRESIDLIWSKVDGWTADHLQEALIGASSDGHREVDILLNKVDGWKVNHLWEALRGASRSGHRDIVDILLNKADGWTVDHLREALIGASSDGHRDIVDILLNKVDGWTLDHLQEALRGASRSGHRDIVDILNHVIIMNTISMNIGINIYI